VSDAPAEYVEYFLNSRASVVQLELLEISHPSFSQTYRIVRNAADGVTIDLSDDEQNVAFIYRPIRVSSLGAKDDLDAAIRVELGDLGEILPAETDRVRNAATFRIKPAVRFWAARSDTLAVIFGPLELEVTEFGFNADGAAFEAKAPALNTIRTGERYRLDRFPMLRGFI
jgi:hypothetical protein